MLDSIATAVSGSAWTYLLLLAVCAGDAVFPALPSETMVVAAAVLAAHGHLSIVLVVLAAAGGALLGDNGAYGIGKSGLRRLADRLMTRSEKTRKSLEWGREQLERHGMWIIVVARFIPGGRTATTYVAGTVSMPWKRRFLPATAVAAILWGLYASGLGYLGGAAFEDNLWLPMLIGAGVGLLVGAVGELVRRKVLDRDTADRGRGQKPCNQDASAAERHTTAPAATAGADTEGPSRSSSGRNSRDGSRSSSRSA